MRWRGSSGGSSRSRTGSASGRDWDWKWEEGRSREREREESLVNYASLEVSTAVAAMQAGSQTDRVLVLCKCCRDAPPLTVCMYAYAYVVLV